jgi:hypothetical protein
MFRALYFSETGHLHAGRSWEKGGFVARLINEIVYSLTH